MGLLTVLPEAGSAVPWADAWLLASLGLVGSSLLDRFRDEDDPADGDGDGGSLLDDGDGGGGGGLGGGGGGALGGGDDGGGGGLGGLDDGGDDGGGEGDDLGDLGGMGGDFDDDPFGEDEGEEQTAELANRVDELENEVANLSSTVNTVRSENEEISEQVEDIAEDVRNLLDIYEMVTRGINPFVDEGGGGGMGGDMAGGDSSFGLFDDEEEEQDDEELDEDIADADAEGFFDDELAEEGAIEEPEDDEDLGEMPEDDDDLGEMPEDDETDDLDAEFGDMEEMDEDDDFGDFEEDDDEADEPESEENMASDSNGKSFSELKDEYESGDAEWAEGEEGEESPDEMEEMGDTGMPDDSDDLGLPDDEPSDDPLDGMDDGFGAETDADDGFGTDDQSSGFEPEPEPEPEPTPQQTRQEPRQPAETARQTDPSQEGGFDFVDENELSDERQKPYLRHLPDDYVGDLMVMEWLEYLVEEGDTTDAVRAINYYERVEWLSPEVAEQLKSFLSGFGEIDRNLIDRPGTAKLDLQHHTQSLKYIMQLTNATAESVVLDRWPQLSEGRHGHQR